MANDNLTIVAEGDLRIRDLELLFERFGKLIRALSSEVAHEGRIEWTVDDLRSGSAILTAKGISHDQDAVVRTVGAYGNVADALARGETPEYSQRVVRSAENLRKLLNGHVTTLRFSTPENEWAVSSPTQRPQKNLKPRFGAIKGWIQTLSARQSLRFTLFDSIFDQPVSCYITEDQLEQARRAWQHRVIVEGRIWRDAETGRPTSIREIETIKIQPVPPPGTYQRARGALQDFAGEEPAEQTIRRLRDVG